MVLSFPGLAVSQTTGKTQAKGQTAEKPQPQAQAQTEKKAPEMACPMMTTGKMPPEMEKKMRGHIAQMMKGQMEQMQKQIDALRQQVEALEKKKK
jgi:polyhydroxyalkanoate synthesis regulator phasin